MLEKGLAIMRETYEALGIAWTLQDLQGAAAVDDKKRLACVREQCPCESRLRTFTEEDVVAVLKEAEGAKPAC